MKTNEEYSYNQIIEEARRIMDKANHLKSEWVITSYEADKSRNGLIESPLAPNYKGKDTNPLNLDNPNPTTKE
ncbi:hypothetical protein ACQJ55_06485 [Helicobacter pylori]|nr:hypothetical protein KVK00_02150 [Helicobacter pylori]